MLVMEYAAKFNELSLFTPTQVVTEHARMNRFEHRLDHSIKWKFAAIMFTSFQDIYHQALEVERLKKEANAEYKAWMQGKRKMGMGNSQGGHFNRRPFPFKNNGEGSQSKPYCHRYKRHHHSMRNFPTGACFGCGEMGI